MPDEIKPKVTKPIEEPAPSAPPAPARAESRPVGAAPSAPPPKAHDKTKTANLYEAFRLLPLPDYSASLLAAHAWSTVEAPEAMGRTEAVTWAAAFQRLHPVPWCSLANGNLNGFVADLKRSNLEGLSVDAYAELMTAIRG